MCLSHKYNGLVSFVLKPKCLPLTVPFFWKQSPFTLHIKQIVFTFSISIIMISQDITFTLKECPNNTGL